MTLSLDIFAPWRHAHCAADRARRACLPAPFADSGTLQISIFSRYELGPPAKTLRWLQARALYAHFDIFNGRRASPDAILIHASL